MADDLYIRVSEDVEKHVTGQGPYLRLGAGVTTLSPGIDHMAGNPVVATGSVGHLPGVHLAVLVPVDQVLQGAIQMDDVRISQLLPAVFLEVPLLQVPAGHLPSCGGVGAMDHEVFKFSHVFLNKGLWN